MNLLFYEKKEGNNLFCRKKRNILYPIPSFYKHVQEKYWQVEPFGYWQIKKLPCFMMAAPAIFIVLYGFFFELSRLRIMHGCVALFSFLVALIVVKQV